MKKLFCFFVIIIALSCSRQSSQREELLKLTQYLSAYYELSYHGVNSNYDLTGSIQIEGAGLHLKIHSKQLTNGYLYLILYNFSTCHFDFPETESILWNLNNNYSLNGNLESGMEIVEGKIKRSFNYHYLMKYLKRPKKYYSFLEEGERLSLEQRTLLFYYSPQSLIRGDDLIYIGCAEIHST